MSKFEFDSDQDEPIAILGGAMQNYGALVLLASSLGLAGALVSLVWISVVSKTAALLGAAAVIAQLVVGWQLVGAGRTLIDIPRTEGNDLPLLMAAVRRMTAINLLQALGMVLGWGLVAIALMRLL